MSDWYFDNNRNVSRELIDSIIPVLNRYRHSSKINPEYIYAAYPEEYYGIEKPDSVLSCLRDIGAITEKNKMTYVTSIYADGKLSFEEYMVELLSKRNDEKLRNKKNKQSTNEEQLDDEDNSSENEDDELEELVEDSADTSDDASSSENNDSKNVKPFAVICSVFYLMIKEGINEDRLYLDRKEIATFLTKIEKYSDITEDFVKKIIDSKEGSLPNVKGDYVGIWINKLADTPYFMTKDGERNTVKLCPFIELVDFYKFIYENAGNISIAPMTDKKKYRTYFENEPTGIIEIIPKLPLLPNIDISNLDAKRMLDYIFGINRKDINFVDWFTEDCFGLYKTFNCIPRIVIHAISLQSKDFADKLWNCSNIKLTSRTKGGLHPRYNRAVGGYNKIYYGIPGCGKSFTVSNKVLEKVSKDNQFRTTFFLDYTNADFIGQLIPKTENGNVTYEASYGPFTKALKRAYETDDMVYLVIEEITRGNAAAIFGDLFQLLDRLDEKKAKEKGGNNKPGDSEFPITNTFLEDYLGIDEGRIIIPSNLTILATMNTSDQNVFPLDTAFKRRWDRERVTANWEEVPFGKKCIPYTNFTWEHFTTSINGLMDGEDAKGTISEDKKIGPFFINDEILVDEEQRDEKNADNDLRWLKFTNNVVDYLFNDVSQFDHTVLFSEEYSYDKVYSDMIQVSKASTMEERVLKFVSIFKNKIKGDVADGKSSSHNANGGVEGANDEANNRTTDS